MSSTRPAATSGPAAPRERVASKPVGGTRPSRSPWPAVFPAPVWVYLAGATLIPGIRGRRCTTSITPPPGPSRSKPQETVVMPLCRADRAPLPFLAVILAAVVGASAGAQDGYSPAGRGVPVIGDSGGGHCESCRSGQRPPWHGNAMAGRSYPVGADYGSRGPCMSGACGPGPVCRSCGPKACGPGACGPCGAPGICGMTGFCHPPMGAGSLGACRQYPLPPCLPRLHSCLRDGILLSPQPLVIPRCHQCGAHIPGGF